MSKQSNMRWLSLTAGRTLPKGKRGKWAKIREAKRINKLNSSITTRQATPEELASLKGIPPIRSTRKTPKRGELPP